MIYIKLLALILLAIIIPPLAVYRCGGTSNQVVINFCLWFFFLIPGMVHALVIVSNYEIAQRAEAKKDDPML